MISLLGLIENAVRSAGPQPGIFTVRNSPHSKGNQD